MSATILPVGPTDDTLVRASFAKLYAGMPSDTLTQDVAGTFRMEADIVAQRNGYGLKLLHLRRELMQNELTSRDELTPEAAYGF